MKSFGCDYFALLFDDIDCDLSPEDDIEFSSVAEAQAKITNTVYQHLNQPQIFLFCPTGRYKYGDVMDNGGDSDCPKNIVFVNQDYCEG